MRRYFSTLLGICLLASVNGCVSTAVGGGTTGSGLSPLWKAYNYTLTGN